MKTPRKDILRALGNVIRTRRKKLGLTQEEIANKSGLHRTYIGDIERGTRNVAIVNFWKLASALEWCPDRMMQHICNAVENSQQ